MLGILNDVRVLEITNTLSGAFCAKLLADQGANTLKIEPPGRGDPARHEPPFIGGEPHPERSTLFLAFNTNKRSVTLNLGTPTGRDIFLRLVRNVDVVVETYPPGHLDSLGIGYSTLQKFNPRLILTSITYFGQTGPYSQYKGDDLIIQAMGGFLYAVTGLAGKPPMGTVLSQTEIIAARNAAIATMAALFQQRETDEGQHIDVSLMEAMVSTPGNLIQQYSFTGGIIRRGSSALEVLDGAHLKTKDGEVTLTTTGTGGRPMETWAEFLEEPRLLDPKFTTRQGRTKNAQELLEIVQAKLEQWNNLDLMRETMARGLVIGLVQSPEQVVSSPHLAERGSFVEMDHPNVGTLKYAGAGFLIDGANPMKGSRAAPRLGEHNAAVYCGELGLSTEELGLLCAAGVV